MSGSLTTSAILSSRARYSWLGTAAARVATRVAPRTAKKCRAIPPLRWPAPVMNAFDGSYVPAGRWLAAAHSES